MNPSLEEYDTCPKDLGGIWYANHWNNPVLPGNFSDYWNIYCFDSLYPWLQSSYYPFFQHAHFGNGYGGIFINSCDINFTPASVCRYYLQGSLSDSLVAGQCYYCEFWTKLFNCNNENSFCAIDAISIFFSDTFPIIYDTEQFVMYYPAQINNPVGRIITDTSNWTKITDTFVAQGGERFFTVGTFRQASDVNVIYFGTPHINFSYYFFDNFFLCPCEDTIPPQEPPGPPNLVYIPNVFTPNKDENNDELYIHGVNIKEIDFRIYNRWGNLVFRTDNIANGWDGKFNDKDCDLGVYFYYAKVIFSNDENVLKKGNITLLR